VHWVRRFIYFSGRRHPRELGEAEVTAFLSHLAVDRNVAAATQNQALSALLFLYRHVLQLELGWLKDIERASRLPRTPTVLSRQEVERVLGQLHGTRWLIASLLYGSGLRVLECLRLRVKDVDFSYLQILVRDGKGNKDRVTMLPEALVRPLRAHLERVRALHARDLKEGFGEVHLPFALARKYPINRCRSAGSRTRCAHAPSPSTRAATRCAIRSRRTSSNRATTSARCRSFSAIRTCRRRWCTRTS